MFQTEHELPARSHYAAPQGSGSGPQIERRDNMAKTSRWMSWVLDESAKTDADMPWSRKAGASSSNIKLATEAPALSYTKMKSA